MDEKPEQMESENLQKISGLAKSGNPAALQQIAQIADQMIEAQKAEMAQSDGGQDDSAEPSFADRVMARIQKNKGE